MSLEFWQEKPATVDGMVLVDDCDILDRMGGRVFFRESRFVGSIGTAPSKDNPTRYRSDGKYR